ncbi:MAG: glycosyltransferase family 61 protein [Microbacteriaceae bacterium]|nr:glycosyltransferase family 61 protein [Microbacteriaceae bacterium]
MYSLIQRALHRLRTIDLDSRAKWPKHVQVIENDEFGPLVISIGDATVFPDMSVWSRGAWILSANFGIRNHRNNAPETIDHREEKAFIMSFRDSFVGLVSNVGPRLATLARTRPGLAAIVSPSLQAVSWMAKACGLSIAGTILRRGSAHRVPSAVFVRLPSPRFNDAQLESFSNAVRSSETSTVRNVYLEQNHENGKFVNAAVIADIRFEHEKAGALLVAIRSPSAESVMSAVANATKLTLESAALTPFVQFARQSAEIVVVDSNVRHRRDPSRVTASGRFEMDDALRRGLALPRGVEVISRPDYDVTETTVDAHQVFEDGRWRTQSTDVLREHSLGPWLMSVKNAIVAPDGSVLLEDGTVLSGTYFGEPFHDSNIDGWIVAESAERAGLALTKQRTFGHALLQVAPRVDALTRFDSSMELLVNDYAWDDRALMNRLGVSLHNITRVSRAQLQHLIRVPELIVSTQLQPERRTARSDPKWMSDFVERFTVASPPTAPRRVYFARRDDSGERGGCANRHEIRALAEEYGYETIVPELLSFDEQVDLVASTVDMIGEQGSALNWSMVMPRESRLVMVHNKDKGRKAMDVTFHNSVLSARGASLYDVRAVRAGGPPNFEIDPRALRRALETLT